MMNTSEKKQPTLISSLLNPALYAHRVENIELIETHISWVILTGPYAYKIKKPLNLGFLDFTRLEKRHFYCNEELRLNQRLAAGIYLDVIPITGTPELPVLNGKNKAIEYAVKMHQFPQAAQLDRLLESSGLDAEKMDAVAHLISDFHQQADRAKPDTHYGDLEHVYRPIKENFRLIRELIFDDKYLSSLTELEHFAQSKYALLKPVFEQRKQEGFIRECHGDLHLRNLAWFQEGPLAFDCIEFNPDFRWIDTMSEVAFFVMDLQDRGQSQLAQRFLNSYLEDTGDYAGLAVLPYYLCYRALVRAKIDLIRAQQSGESEQDVMKTDFLAYLQLANSYTHPPAPKCIITRGLSASGKSTLTQLLLQRMGAMRIRSDVERKRLFGLKAKEDSRANIDQGIYSTEATRRTYEKLIELAETILDAGYSVIVDAVFLNFKQRDRFQELAVEKQVPYLILEFIASPDSLRKRIQARKDDVSEADLAVLENQLAHWEPLFENEKRYRIKVNTEDSLNPDSFVEEIRLYT